MPSRNIIKHYAGDAVYHIYNRGVEKRNIFIEEDDYAVFLNLLKRYLSPEPSADKLGRISRTYYGEIELMAFCLMPNHFHILVWQKNPDGITKLMQSVCTSYTGYFNKKYKRVGSLFQGRYKASHITSDGYYQHISRYIHLNPLDIKQGFEKYPYSSLPYYLGRQEAKWVRPQKVLSDFNDSSDYLKFVRDYEAQKEILDQLKYELANT